MNKNYVITISRQYGSGGREIGRRLAEALGVQYYNKELLSMAAEESGLCKEFIRNSLVDVPSNKFWYALAINPQALMTSTDNGFLTADMANKALCEAVRGVADKGSCVIVGRYAGSILKDRENVLRIFITADYEDRLQKIIKRDGLSEKAAASKMKKVDKERATYADLHFNDEWGKSESYDLCINCTKVGLDGAVEIIKKMLELR
ncbi:MAG: AAA family ATPase [Bacillota bacterium]|jgi:cytidylate kinase